MKQGNLESDPLQQKEEEEEEDKIPDRNVYIPKVVSTTRIRHLYFSDF